MEQDQHPPWLHQNHQQFPEELNLSKELDRLQEDIQNVRLCPSQHCLQHHDQHYHKELNVFLISLHISGLVRKPDVSVFERSDHLKSQYLFCFG